MNDINGVNGTEPAPAEAGDAQAPPEQFRPTHVLLAGEEERDDEPHIERGID